MGVEVLESGAGLRGRRGSSPETEEIVEAIRGYVKETMAKKETMLTRYFYAHGWFCASRPWEVIIGMITLTVCTMSMSIMASTRRVCGWHYKCFDTVDDTRSSDTIILSITRCLAVIYLYLQFRKMRKLGSKYLLGMAGVFTIASSIIFSVAVINIIGADLTGLHEALPFFLLLVDLSKACTLAKVAFSALNEDEVVEYIANGMSKLGPQLTLDAIVETLVIGVGTLSGIRTLETMCCFGCLSVIANYLAFMTFYPACLALILEVTRGNRALVQLKLLVKVWQEEEDSEKPNPVTQRVKVIMSTGLVFVHVHSRLFMAGEETGSVGAGEGDSGVSGLGLSPQNLEISPPQIVMPEVSLCWFYLTKIATMSVDYVLTLLLAVLLSIKYVYFDEDTSRTRVTRIDDTNDTAHESEAKDVTDFVSDNCQSSQLINPHNLIGCHCESDRTITPPSTTSSRRDSPVQGSLFVVGDSSDEDDAETNKNKNKICVETQTEPWVGGAIQKIALDDKPARELKECVETLKSDIGAAGLSDEEIIQLVHSKHIPPYKLESMIGDHERGVNIRRQLIASSIGNKSVLENLPFTNYDYKYVDGACCENVSGYMPVPVGVAGPLLLDGKKVSIPMATTEGCLVASTNRGCRALSTGVGVTTTVYRDGMTRGPVVRFSSAQRASEVHQWLEDKDNYDLVADAFDSTSRFARLQKLQIIQVSRSLYIRFLAVTGDAMGMNMLSKGSEKALTMLQEKFFPDMEIMSLSGNICTDKKPSALNWIEGRGKSVVAEAIVSSDVIKNVLKTSVSALVDLNINKNLIGSAAAGSIGGFNAQAANIVTAIYIATGQDPAQNVCSSHCITLMEATGPQNEDLYISCTMPSIEVGTVGGGTVLPPQAACLEMLGVRGSHKEKPGTNAADLARIICGAVMAGELSLMSALAAGHLVRSHLKHNRSVQNMAPADAAASAVLPRRGSAAAAVSSTSTAAGAVKSAASAATNATIAASSAAVNSTAANSAVSAGVKASATANSAVNSADSAGSTTGVQSGSHPVASSDNSHITTPHINHLAPVSSSSSKAASTDLKSDPALFHANNTQPSDKEPGTCLKSVS